MIRLLLLLSLLGVSRFDVRGEVEGLQATRKAPIGNWEDSATYSCSEDFNPKENEANFLALTPLLTDSSGFTVGDRYLGLLKGKLEGGPHVKVLGQAPPRLSNEEGALSRKHRFSVSLDGYENPKRLEMNKVEDGLDNFLKKVLVKALYQPNKKVRYSSYEKRRSLVTVPPDAHLGDPTQTNVETKPLNINQTKPIENITISERTATVVRESTDTARPKASAVSTIISRLDPLNDVVELNGNESRIFGDLESVDSEKLKKNGSSSRGNKTLNNNGSSPDPEMGFTRNSGRLVQNASCSSTTILTNEGSTLGVTLGSTPETSSVRDCPKPGGKVSSTPSHSVSSTTRSCEIDRNLEVASTPTSTQMAINAATTINSTIFVRIGLEHTKAKHS